MRNPTIFSQPIAYELKKHSLVVWVTVSNGITKTSYNHGASFGQKIIARSEPFTDRNGFAGATNSIPIWRSIRIRQRKYIANNC